MKPCSVKTLLVIGLVVAGGLLATACASYYRVTDPVSGSVYYTQKVERAVGGAAQFKDQRSGSEVTIQNSEVKEIDPKEYEAGLKSTPTPKTAPVPAPATGSGGSPSP